jgi:N,N'-diacetylbacillosaminyl-diphospho-undecaprenol alpha-1,3-N-acetylgalactosaminyltransferase
VKIALITNDDAGMLYFRGGLIKALISRQIEVFVIVPKGPFIEKLEALGAKSIAIEMYRFISPIKDLRLMWQFYQIFKLHQFDLVHTITIKPNIFGTLAAKAAGIKTIVSLISGIGFVFSERHTVKAKVLRQITLLLYKLALGMSQRVWFQNQDDLDYFLSQQIIDREKGIVIRGSGVDLSEYSNEAIDQNTLSKLRQELNLAEHLNCVAMITSRAIWSKGIREFIEAAELLMPNHPEWAFIAVCPEDSGSPDSVPPEYFARHRSERLIIVENYRLDIQNFIALANIMVLVSYYREGVPRILLEGLSMSKPIITADSVGCKEVVENYKNGYLVPPKNSEALAEKLETLIKDKELRKLFGDYSRYLAETFFDEQIVVERVLGELYQL